MVHSGVKEISGIGPVLFRRSKRAKRLNISVKPFAGVQVSVPERLPFSKAEEFVLSRTQWIRKHQARMKQIEQDYETFSDIAAGIDRAKAKEKLIGRLDELAVKHGFTYNRVFIRNQKTKWGSCSRQNNIGLNVKLVVLPDELIDYVILHELAHTKVRNHSRHFWAYLDGIVENVKALDSRLKGYKSGFRFQ